MRRVSKQRHASGRQIWQCECSLQKSVPVQRAHGGEVDDVAQLWSYLTRGPDDKIVQFAR